MRKMKKTKKRAKLKAAGCIRTENATVEIGSAELLVVFTVVVVVSGAVLIIALRVQVVVCRGRRAVRLTEHAAVVVPHDEGYPG